MKYGWLVAPVACALIAVPALAARTLSVNRADQGIWVNGRVVEQKGVALELDRSVHWDVITTCLDEDSAKNTTFKIMTQERGMEAIDANHVIGERVAYGTVASVTCTGPVGEGRQVHTIAVTGPVFVVAYRNGAPVDHGESNLNYVHTNGGSAVNVTWVAPHAVLTVVAK